MLNANPIAWFEIVTKDIDSAIQFYQSVFAITLKKEKMDDISMALFPYTEGQTGGALVSGDCYKNHTHSSGASIIYLSVQSIGDCLKNVERYQGKTAFPCTSIGENGYIAGFTDLEGNMIGIWSDKP